jgi:phosphohistidine swiveling domain-containing protein
MGGDRSGLGRWTDEQSSVLLCTTVVEKMKPHSEVKHMRVETRYGSEDSSNDSGVLWLESSDHKEFVVDIKDRCEMELVGGKAYNISKLVREGFAVPEGFCITTRAYEYFLDYNRISEEDKDIGDRIRGGLMPPLLAEIIRDTYHTHLQGNPCAVRSSSPFEDLKSASFAGQYTSLLNVRGDDALLDAVKECWASLWDRPAVEYRKKKGIENENVKMAVLVQEMCPATVSGILFTEDNIVIEAVWGLGDILVGGKIIPDHFVVEREKLKVIERKISRKSVMSQIKAGGGVETIEVPEHLRNVPALEDANILKLCILGKQVEDFFGCPQDIEWALYNGSIVLLQARPVTAKQTQTVWSRANLAEMLPGYVTYLSRIPENRPDFFVLGIRPLLECFGLDDIPEDLKLTDYIYGHIYVNMTAVHDTLGRIPGLSPELLDESMGHKSEGEPGSKPGLSTMVRLLPGALKILRFFSHLPQEAKQVIPHSLELIEDIRYRNLQSMTIEELDKLVWEMYERTSNVFQVHACTALANASIFSILKSLLKRIGEEGTENLLTVGLKGMSSSQLGIEMWKLAESARKSPRVSELILSRKAEVLENLGRFTEGIKFLEEMNESMESIGDRCSQELELSVPRWEENPHFVLSMVANYLSSTVRPAKAMDEQKQIRQEATDRILKKLSRNPFERLLFEKILEKSQQFIVVRENLKTTWVRGISAMRILYLAISEKLVENGVLEEKNDIFYLKMTEVSDIVASNIQKGVGDLIQERKREREICEHLDVPEIIMGKPLHVEELKYTVEPKEKLEGTGCSQGVITGKARVILDPNKCPDLKEGEILIAPVTDPGWTPLFVIAGGLVMELGGTLSHGVIIAREYGIPAVVGVKDATKIIKTGQLMTVDGNKGVVYIRE